MHLEKRILITGGAGFLGSHLCERLLSAGAVVVCVDNFFTGARRNVEHLLDHRHFEVIRHDVTFSLYVEVDEIYNLACPASPIHYQHYEMPHKWQFHRARLDFPTRGLLRFGRALMRNFPIVDYFGGATLLRF
jgi:NAD dependent epimerase/dehydratase family enzyme